MDKTENFRQHLLSAFNRGVKAAKAGREICAVHGKGTMSQKVPSAGSHAQNPQLAGFVSVLLFVW